MTVIFLGNCEMDSNRSKESGRRMQSGKTEGEESGGRKRAWQNKPPGRMKLYKDTKSGNERFKAAQVIMPLYAVGEQNGD